MLITLDYNYNSNQWTTENITGQSWTNSYILGESTFDWDTRLIVVSY